MRTTRSAISATTARGGRAFASCLLGFLPAASLVTLSHHFALLWIRLETTTLSVAPLISRRHDRRSLEAVWKYLMLSSVGIALALLGIFLLATAQPSGANGGQPLVLDDLMAHAAALDPVGLRAALVSMSSASARRWDWHRCIRGSRTRTARRQVSRRTTVARPAVEVQATAALLLHQALAELGVRLRDHIAVLVVGDRQQPVHALELRAGQPDPAGELFVDLAEDLALAHVGARIAARRCRPTPTTSPSAAIGQTGCVSRWSTSPTCWTAGDVDVVRGRPAPPRSDALPTCASARSSARSTNSSPGRVGLTGAELERMYRLLAIADYEDRDVIRRRTPSSASA